MKIELGQKGDWGLSSTNNLNINSKEDQGISLTLKLNYIGIHVLHRVWTSLNWL